MLNYKLFSAGDVVAVALSGGKDSMFLLRVLAENQQKLNITVKAINVEHGIRGESSLADSRFVKEYCDNEHIALLSYSVDSIEYSKKTGKGVEQSARILRYNCFADAIDKGFCNKVATAHHSADNCETMLFNLFRGSAPSGLCGIPEQSADGRVIRPILSCTRKEIDDYLSANGIPFVVDQTNFENDYTRNYLRNKVIPLIKEKFPSAESAINRYFAISQRESAYLDSLAENIIDKNKIIADLSTEPVLFARACIIVMKRLGFVVDYTAAHVNELDKLLHCETGKMINLKNGINAFKTYDGIVFEKGVDNFEGEIPFATGRYEINGYALTIERADPLRADLKDRSCLYFDGDKLPYGSIIRTKRAGDTITPFGGGSKTLKKYLCDKKIEARVSALLPMVAHEKNVLVVGNIGISDQIKVDKATTNMLKLTCLKIVAPEDKNV